MGNEQKPQLRNNQNGGELSFIVYNQSPVSNGSGLRHHVRSHAARSGWTGRKRNSTVVSGTLHPDSRNPSPPKRPHRQAATPRKARCAPYQAIAASPCKASVPKRSAGVSPATEPRTTKPAEKKYDGIQRRYMEVVLNEVYPLQSSIGNVYDSCSFFSVPWKPVFGVLIDFWLHRASPAFLGKSNNAEDDSRFLRMAFELSVATEPATFYAMLGLAAAKLPSLHPLAPVNEPRLSSILQRKATEELMEVMTYPSRAISNPAILSVLLLAETAILNGQGEAAEHFHLQVLRRLTQLRGGAQAIATSGDAGLMLARKLVSGSRVCTSTCRAQLQVSHPDKSLFDATDWKTGWPGIEKRMHTLRMDKRNKRRHDSIEPSEEVGKQRKSRKFTHKNIASGLTCR